MEWIQGTSANVGRSWGSDLVTSINVDRSLPTKLDIRSQQLVVRNQNLKPKRKKTSPKNALGRHLKGLVAKMKT